MLGRVIGNDLRHRFGLAALVEHVASDDQIEAPQRGTRARPAQAAEMHGRQAVQRGVVGEKGLGQRVQVGRQHVGAASLQHEAGQPDAAAQFQHALTGDVEGLHGLGEALPGRPQLAEQRPLRAGDAGPFGVAVRVVELLVVSEHAKPVGVAEHVDIDDPGGVAGNAEAPEGACAMGGSTGEGAERAAGGAERSARRSRETGPILRASGAGSVNGPQPPLPGSGEVAPEPRDGALPGQRRRGLVVARRGVVVEAVVRARVDVRLVDGARGLQRSLVGRPGGVDVGVGLGEVQLQRGLDAGHVLGFGLPAVERHRRGQRRVGHGRRVRHTTAVAEAGDADLAVAEPARAQVVDGGEEVVHQLHRVDLLLKPPPVLVVARIPAHRAQAVGRQGHETGLRHAARHVLDVGVEAAVLVHHHDARHRTLHARRAHEVGAHLAVALRRGVAHVFGAEAGVGEAHLLRQRVVRRERGEQGRSRQAAHREARRAVEEVAAAQAAVHVAVVELEELRVEILGGQAGHAGLRGQRVPEHRRGPGSAG